jgi:predicted MPP superfamily phosphohydrolase
LLISLGIVLAVIGGLHGYLWFRLVRSPEVPAPWFRPATAVLAFLAVYLPLGFLLQRTVPRQMGSAISWPLYIWMGTAFLLLVLLLAGEAVRLGFAIGHLLSGSHGVLPVRDLSRGIALVALVAGVLLSGVAMLSALLPPRVKRVRCELARWPATLSPYTIAQVSDIHVGPTIGRPFVSRMVERVNRLHPDLIAITGDLVDGTVRELAGEVAPISKLRARDGVFFVTGNHEYYSGVEPWVREIRSLGIPVLRGSRVAIGGAEGFDLAGVDDWSARSHDPAGHHEEDLPRALEGHDPLRPVILLAHQPRAAIQAAKEGVDLQLSGHTHGGQIFPFHALASLAQPFLSGLHRIGGTAVYVSRGTGYWGPPMRLLAPAEITILELVRPESERTGGGSSRPFSSAGVPRR